MDPHEAFAEHLHDEAERICSLILNPGIELAEVARDVEARRAFCRSANACVTPHAGARSGDGEPPIWGGWQVVQ